MKHTNDNLSRHPGRVHFPSGLRDIALTARSWAQRAGIVAVLAAAPACGPKDAAAPTPEAPTAPAPEKQAEPAPVIEADVVTPETVVTAPPEPPPIELPPPGPNPTLPLVEHSGSITGPVSWVVAESAGAIPTSPLIVLLHGRGDNPESFVRLAWRLAPFLRTPVRFIAARAPHPVGLAQGRQWFDPRDGGPEASLEARFKDFDVFLGRLKEVYPEAPAPVLVGFSQGAMMALHLALGRPTAIAGAAGLSGGLVTVSDETADAPDMKRPPVFVAAGDRDTIVDAQRSWTAANTLETRGHAVTRYPFKGSHRVDDNELAALGAWLRPLLAPVP